MLLALAPLTVASCQDSPTDPMVGVVAGESSPALALDISFADPENLIGTGESLDADGVGILERWRDSWTLETEKGHAVRGALYPRLEDALASMVRPGDLDRELASMADALRRAQTIPRSALLPRLANGLDAAAGCYASAVAARGRGDTREAVSMIVRGGDALREVGPEAVARSLQQDVAAAYGSISPSDAYSSQDLERLERLVRGSQQAIEQSDWVLAIRRAYYARALLGKNGG